MNIIQWQLSFWYGEGWGHSGLNFNLYSYWMLSIFYIKKYFFITWKTIFWEAQVIKWCHWIRLSFAISTNHLLIIAKFNHFMLSFCLLFWYFFFLIWLSHVSYISRAIFRRKRYGLKTKKLQYITSETN